MIEKPIDPGNEVSKVKPHSLQWIISLLRKHTDMTLARGEGGLLLAEIDRLQEEVRRLEQMAFYHNPPSGIEEPGR